MTLSATDIQRLARFSIDHSLDAALWTQADGTIQYANLTASRILGFPVDQLIGQSIFNIAPELNPSLWRELWKEIRARNTFAFEFILQGTEQRPVQVDMTVHRFEIEAQDFACLFFRDTQERQRLKVLEQEFVSTVSHELRTPLTVIREGVSQVIDGLRGTINDQQQRALSIALSGIDRLGRMIGDLLDLSKIEAGKGTLRCERIDCVLAREVAASFQTMAEDRGIELRITTPAGAVIVFADRDRLIQVLTNLVGNAFKFTEKGHIELVLIAQPKTVTCSVIDTGVGFSFEDLGKLFSKFEQLGRASFTGERGTGLGLSISKAIVEAHKGRLWCESAGPGKGSRFSVELPRQSARDVFHEQLNSVMNEAALRGGCVSVLIYEMGQRAPEADNLRVLENLEDLIRQQQGRRPAIMIKDSHALYLALPSTVRKEAERMAAKIKTTFQDAQARIASFPEDEADHDRFLSRIFSVDKS